MSPRLLNLVAYDDKQFAERLHKRLWSEKWRKEEQRLLEEGVDDPKLADTIRAIPALIDAGQLGLPVTISSESWKWSRRLTHEFALAALAGPDAADAEIERWLWYGVSDNRTLEDEWAM